MEDFSLEVVTVKRKTPDFMPVMDLLTIIS